MSQRSVFQSEVVAGTCIVTPLRQISEFSEESVVDELEIVQKECEVAGARDFVFDFRFLKQLSSAMLEILLTFRRRAVQHGGALACFNLHPLGQDVLKLSRFDTFLEICGSREAALQSVRGGS